MRVDRIEKSAVEIEEKCRVRRSWFHKSVKMPCAGKGYLAKQLDAEEGQGVGRFSEMPESKGRPPFPLPPCAMGQGADCRMKEFCTGIRRSNRSNDGKVEASSAEPVATGPQE